MWKYMLMPLALAALILSIACGDDEGDGVGGGQATAEDQTSAEQNLCASVDTFAASLVALDGLDVSTASAEDYESAVADVREAWDQVEQDAVDVAEADITALESAQDDLDQAIEDAPADEPVSDAVASLSEEVTAVRSTLREAGDGLGCPVSS